MNAVGTNTAESTSAMPITGPEISSIALMRRVFGSHALFDVPLHRLHHDDGIVHHQADRQHQSEQRQRVDGESEHREEHERPTSDTGTASNGISVARQPCRKM